QARALLGELNTIDRTGRITEEGRQLRELPLPPRLARMVVDAAAAGEAKRAAEIAVVLTERGLGGNDVDLGHRLDALRHDRSKRANEARAMARRWAEIAKANCLQGEAESRRGQGRSYRSARFLRSPIPTASPRTAAPAAPSSWPTGGARMSMRPRRL